MLLVQCTFAGNTLFPSALGSSVIEASLDFASTDPSPQVRLQGCTFSNNTPPTLLTLLADNRKPNGLVGAVFYSDNVSPPICSYEGDNAYSEVQQCCTSSALPLEQAGDGFLTASSAWFLEVQEVRLSVFR